MAISFELHAHSEASGDLVFHTLADLRNWDTFAGVVLAGPPREVSVDDRVDVRLRVMRRDIRMGCVVTAVDEPTPDTPGGFDVRSVEGPFDARVIGTATPTTIGCDIGVEIYGIGRGAAILLEAPVEIVMRQWATHQLRHLLGLAELSQGVRTFAT
jgi:hypothetical protein